MLFLKKSVNRAFLFIFRAFFFLLLPTNSKTVMTFSSALLCKLIFQNTMEVYSSLESNICPPAHSILDQTPKNSQNKCFHKLSHNLMFIKISIVMPSFANHGQLRQFLCNWRKKKIWQSWNLFLLSCTLSHVHQVVKPLQNHGLGFWR